MTAFQIHGLTVSSDLRLEAAELPATARFPIDLRIERGEPRSIGDDDPNGDVIADGTTGGRRFYTAARTDDGVLMRYPALCDFVISPELDVIKWHLDPACDEEFASILLSGTVLAVVLILRGELMLHSSAVDVDGHAIAFVGAAGMGKSTLGALVAMQAGSLMTDDALRVQLDDGQALCHAAAGEARLRASSASLAIGAASTRTTADGRTALQLRVAAAEPVPLRAVVIPYADRGGKELYVERASAGKAHMLVSQFPRVLGWREPASGRRQFQLLADLVERVPVYQVRLPWGPPFAPDLVDQLLTATGWPRSTEAS